MSLSLSSGPFTRTDSQVQGIMLAVMLAMVPATVFGILIFGWPAFFLWSVTLLSALGFEALCLSMAGKPVRAAVLDGSAALSGWLVAMTLPPWAPWWIGVVGAAMAIVVGKQVFGGLGQNLFNPAMLARVTLLVAFPLEMTTWALPSLPFSSSAPGLFESLSITFGGAVPPDGMTGPTIIGHWKTELSQGRGLSESLVSGHYGALSSFFGWQAGSLGETSSLLVALGGLWLLKKKIITWHIPASLLATVALLAGVFALIDGERYAGPLFHLTSGAVMLAAFFIATDYVTSPSSPAGQLIFGAGCGLFIFVIRTWGAYPEGAGFSVLLMNSLTPVIDHYVRPRIYGRDLKGRPLDLPGGRR
ncbi:RnfABCDGE type electron transport complex subunit D [Methylococcus mesophilus]|uniref:RnfABCDGE type electron transport complex subunit D n=1 Tax=Methylococcus mesophilus TaxID=2993564 RepID=UPI00224B451C|nr:RnfABCDGE type electron transport complex subunit D [Methylococcus mesophilus]UZR27206.1 RnfABCDGE type electron transport complex subunit D [Methylococcus mesophilus]